MFSPLKNPKRKSELVSEEIMRAILSGQIGPGQRLPSERGLAQELGVGRAVIRESLRTLEFSGFIRIKSGVEGGAFAQKPDFRIFARYFSDLLRVGSVNIEQLTEARLLIEKNVLELVIQKNEKAHLKPLDEIIAVGFSKLAKGEKIRKENLTFHTVLAELSRNPIFILIINSIMPIIGAFVEALNPPPQHSRDILESHRDILEAIKNKNLKEALKRLEDHILYFNQEFKKVLPIRDIDSKEISNAFSWMEDEKS